MKRFILYLFILLAAVWLGLKVFAQTGYAILVYEHWTVEMPLWFAGLIILAAFFVLYFLLRIFSVVTSLRQKWSFWHKQRGIRRRYKQTTRGLLELAEGKWASAEKLLIMATSVQKTALINYLAAARAAQEQGAYQRRDDYLRAAYQVAPRSELAIGITQAELQLSHHQLEHCLATLRHLQTIAPQHAYVLKLLKGLYLELNDWNSLLTLIPMLKKQQVINSEQARTLEFEGYYELLQKAKKLGDNITFGNLWQQVPSYLATNSQLIYCYAEHLIETGDSSIAEKILHEVLRRAWSDNLVQLYGLAESENPLKQLKTAESWLKEHNNNPVLLLTLGRLSVRNHLWGKAKHYFSEAILLSADPVVYMELGNLLEQLGEVSEALQAYRAGCQKITAVSVTH